jgi:hypothetical protein
VRPNVFYWSVPAHKERQEVKARRREAHAYYLKAKEAQASVACVLPFVCDGSRCHHMCRCQEDAKR